MRQRAGRTNGRILFIAYHFPPSAAVGGLRVVNFATTLRAFGWEPHVLTIADRDIESLDMARLRDVDGIPIHKAAVMPTAMALATRLWMRVRARRAAGGTGGAADQGQAAAPAAAATRAGGRVRRFILSLLALPDWERGWCLPATVRASRIIRRERIDWFMTSCPPYSAHLVGLAVKILTRRRWVADFRDPWMTTGSKRLYPTSAISRRIESWLERQVVRRADLVAFNVDRLRNAYRQRYSDLPEGKFVFIPNGISVRPAPGSVEKDRVFTISYTGSLYVGRSPEPVLKAMALLVRQGRVADGAIRLRLVGHCETIDGVPTASMVKRHGLEAAVEVDAPVPYAVACDIVRRSDLALLLAPNLPYQIPAKVYDYLGAGTRILAIAEEGGTADLLQTTGAGRAFRPDDVESIADFIYDEFASRGSHVSAPVSLERYDVRRITEELTAHLSRIGAAAAAPAR